MAQERALRNILPQNDGGLSTLRKEGETARDLFAGWIRKGFTDIFLRQWFGFVWRFG